jgi:hypothetical protein
MGTPNLPDHLASLPLTELTFHMRSRAPGRLPRFLGPALRGTLGHALRLTACPMQCGPGGQHGAPECFHSGLCAYATLFDPPRAPGAGDVLRSFVMLAPPMAAGHHTEFSEGGALTFGLRLFGPALRHIPAVIGAVARMGRLGLGAPSFDGESDPGAREAIAVEAVRRLAPPAHLPDRLEADALVERMVAWESGRLPFDLEAVTDPRGAEIWTPGVAASAQPVAFALGDADPPAVVDRLRVRLVTPLRLEFGKQLELHPTGRTLVRAALLRLENLSQSYFGVGHGILVRDLLEAASTLETQESGLEPVQSLERYSPHRGHTLPLAGVVGHLDLRGEALGDVAWVLRLAEVLHLGSDTVQGLGRVELAPLE